ncbi:phosphatidylinositol-specific phospholipase C/glycerophosphodiester phosphodiesterase family protein [Streptomyces sp. NPDC004647]|uniref:phosphatidylinositol-specific phospholipase C/glycerophosphodiester phosphodiesterase family protein n=1 Tax=Streptomyces sp. NPDC004647 TaxID=3154671 RepID=UPI0033B22BCD
MPHPTRRLVVASLGGAAAGTLAGSLSQAWAADSAPRPAAAARAVTAQPAGHHPAPLRRAHAHNDYEHTHPLADALQHRFTSVEADIWLVDGKLLVGHDIGDLSPDRTLESLYLDPLLKRVVANHGSVHAGHRVSLQLLIDIKNTGEETYRELHRRLRYYRSILSTAVGGKVRTGPVTPVISGDRAARGPMEAQHLRYAFYDGRLDDLGTHTPASFMPLVSANWTSTFSWNGAGPMPADERAKLHDIVDDAHAHRQRVRFWGTPDTPSHERDDVWHELLDARVDHINTDDLAGLERFLDAFDRTRA